MYVCGKLWVVACCNPYVINCGNFDQHPGYSTSNLAMALLLKLAVPLVVVVRCELLDLCVCLSTVLLVAPRVINSSGL